MDFIETGISPCQLLIYTPPATHFFLNKEMFQFFLGIQHIFYLIFIWKMWILKQKELCPTFAFQSCTIESMAGIATILWNRLAFAFLLLQVCNRFGFNFYRFRFAIGLVYREICRRHLQWSARFRRGHNGYRECRERAYPRWHKFCYFSGQVLVCCLSAF
ncbi:hypothetical protein L6452_15510 [Arctium lappa]|uniref:Uncharacterized protein n=1 Tax=Arctium lappa TaxID=4217 RepID=A0ACB9CP29_ARCLA|nr:hypothetical protein L6452_15510 [Arctium lappa]